MFNDIVFLIALLGFVVSIVVGILWSLRAFGLTLAATAVFVVSSLMLKPTIGPYSGSSPFMQSMRVSLAPELYIERRRDYVGDLMNIDVRRGFLSIDTTEIETTDGFYIVNGIVGASRKGPVYLSGLNDERLDNKLCIQEKCYRLNRQVN